MKKMLLGFVVPLFVVGITCTSGHAISDPIDEAEDVPATAAEIRFINHVLDQVKAALPAMDGWKLKINVSASGNTVREGEPVLIFERARNFPLKISMHFDFHLPSSAEAKRDAENKKYKRDAETIKKELMDAAGRQDMEKVKRLQKELVEVTRARMQASQMANPGAQSRQNKGPSSTARDFRITVILNDGGETIGKAYEKPTPGVTRSFFRTEGRLKGKDVVRYKHYIGDWEVSSLKKNWTIAFPKRFNTAANHLRALTLYVSIYGDRDAVEAYVRDRFRPAAFSAILR